MPQEEPYGYLEGYIDKWVLFALGAELHRSMEPNRFNSAHEAFGALWSAFETFGHEVKREQPGQNPAALTAALLQVAATALKYANQLASEAREDKDGS